MAPPKKKRERERGDSKPLSLATNMNLSENVPLDKRVIFDCQSVVFQSGCPRLIFGEQVIILERI